jgi:hypothetical protein
MRTLSILTFNRRAPGEWLDAGDKMADASNDVDASLRWLDTQRNGGKPRL